MLISLRHEFRYLCFALGLLTRLPVPQGDCSEAPGRSLHWYPAAGLTICLCLALVAQFSAPAFLGAALLLTLWVALTGALHLDGLADCADAWVGGMGNPQRTLEIMKDPACGPMGVTAIACVLLVKFAALVTLVSQPLYWLAIPVLARTLLPIAMYTTPYIRPGGMGSGLAETASRSAIAVSCLMILLIAALSVPTALWWGWIGALGIIYLLWRRSMIQRLGGYTGDGAGALVEIAETVLLVIAVVHAGTAGL